MEVSNEHIERVFRARHVRRTRQREVVYRALASTDTHPTAEELYRLIVGADQHLSLATVYNALDALEKAGLCRRVSASSSQPARFDADMDTHVHVVTPDGRVLDLPPGVGERVMQAVTHTLADEVEKLTGAPVGKFTIQLVPAPSEGGSADH